MLTPRTSDEQQEESRAPRKKEAAGSSRRDDLGGAVSAPNKPWKQQDQIERKTFLELCKEQGPRVELFENPFGRKSVGTIVEVGSNRNGVTIRFQPETGRTRTIQVAKIRDLKAELKVPDLTGKLSAILDTLKKDLKESPSITSFLEKSTLRPPPKFDLKSDLNVPNFSEKLSAILGTLQKDQERSPSITPFMGEFLEELTPLSPQRSELSRNLPRIDPAPLDLSATNLRSLETFLQNYRSARTDGLSSRPQEITPSRSLAESQARLELRSALEAIYRNPSLRSLPILELVSAIDRKPEEELTGSTQGATAIGAIITAASDAARTKQERVIASDLLALVASKGSLPSAWVKAAAAHVRAEPSASVLGWAALPPTERAAIIDRAAKAKVALTFIVGGSEVEFVPRGVSTSYPTNPLALDPKARNPLDLSAVDGVRFPTVAARDTATVTPPSGPYSFYFPMRFGSRLERSAVLNELADPPAEISIGLRLPSGEVQQFSGTLKQTKVTDQFILETNDKTTITLSSDAVIGLTVKDRGRAKDYNEYSGVSFTQEVPNFGSLSPTQKFSILRRLRELGGAVELEGCEINQTQQLIRSYPISLLKGVDTSDDAVFTEDSPTPLSLRSISKLTVTRDQYRALQQEKLVPAPPTREDLSQPTREFLSEMSAVAKSPLKEGSALSLFAARISYGRITPRDVAGLQQEFALQEPTTEASKVAAYLLDRISKEVSLPTGVRAAVDRAAPPFQSPTLPIEQPVARWSEMNLQERASLLEAIRDANLEITLTDSQRSIRSKIRFVTSAYDSDVGCYLVNGESVFFAASKIISVSLPRDAAPLSPPSNSSPVFFGGVDERNPVGHLGLLQELALGNVRTKLSMVLPTGEERNYEGVLRPDRARPLYTRRVELLLDSGKVVTISTDAVRAFEPSSPELRVELVKRRQRNEGTLRVESLSQIPTSERIKIFDRLAELKTTFQITGEGLRSKDVSTRTTEVHFVASSSGSTPSVYTYNNNNDLSLSSISELLLPKYAYDKLRQEGLLSREPKRLTLDDERAIRRQFELLQRPIEGIGARSIFATLSTVLKSPEGSANLLGQVREAISTAAGSPKVLERLSVEAIRGNDALCRLLEDVQWKLPSSSLKDAEIPLARALTLLTSSTPPTTEVAKLAGQLLEQIGVGLDGKVSLSSVSDSHDTFNARSHLLPSAVGSPGLDSLRDWQQQSWRTGRPSLIDLSLHFRRSLSPVFNRSGRRSRSEPTPLGLQHGYGNVPKS